MIQLLKFYWINSIKLKGGKNWLFWYALIYPLLVIGVYVLFKYYEVDLEWVNSGIGKDIVNTLAIVSGFLLTGLSVILSNTRLSSTSEDAVREKYKSYIMEYGGGDIHKRLSKFKLSLLLDTIFLIGICVILALIITVFQSKGFMSYVIIYFLAFLLFNLFSLIKQTLAYLHIVEFNQ